MRYWWVNQNQTYKAEIGGGYIWSPKRNQNGARNQFYENMREVSPGDLIFSFRDRQIRALGIATSNCYEAPRPDEFGAAGRSWEQVGWRADVAYTVMDNPVTPKAHIEQIRPLLPNKYSPLRQNGDGLQSVYLAEISKDFADLLTTLLCKADNTIVKFVFSQKNSRHGSNGFLLKVTLSCGIYCLFIHLSPLSVTLI